MSNYNVEKGKQFENWFSEFVSSVFPHAHRQAGSGNGLKKGDIAETDGWTFELKNSKSFNWKKTSKQVEKASLGYTKCAIIWHPPQSPMEQSVVVLNVQDFRDLLKFSKDHENRIEILELRQ